MSNKYETSEVQCLINRYLSELDPLKGVTERPSLSWAPGDAASRVSRFLKYSRGTSVQVLGGRNDIVVNCSYCPQGPLEKVILCRFADFYMKHAEELPLFRKRPYSV